MGKYSVNGKILVGIVMGSDSDLPTMQPAADILQKFGIGFEIKVVSAHRTPFDMIEYGRSAKDRGINVIIAGAGGAAHLPGMLAATTSLPVIGVPVKSSNMSGTDSLYSIVQMPPGVPVATVAIGGGMNAGILAAQILALSNQELSKQMLDYKTELEELSKKKNDNEVFG